MRKNSPVILFGAGLVGFGTTIVLACKATTRIPEVREQHVKALADLDIENIDKVFSRGSDADKKKVMKVYVKTTYSYMKLYAPAFVSGVLSVASLTRSHQILANRNTALMAAYSGLDAFINKYRNRVVEELGEEKDREFAYGKVEKEIVSYDKKGNTVIERINQPDPDQLGIYQRMFDENNKNWEKNPGYNCTWLENKQRWANDKLKFQGHLFLNEVLEDLGYPHTKEGAQVGWLWDGPGDNYVDFGHSRFGDFMAGFHQSVLLDFNVDGVIWDKI